MTTSPQRQSVSGGGSPDSGNPADVRFSTRILLFLIVTVYGVAAVFLFDLLTGRLNQAADTADTATVDEAPR